MGSIFTEQGWSALTDSAKQLKVILLTEPLAGDTCRIKSTKKYSQTASPAQIKFHGRSQPFQKKTSPQEDRHISPVLVSLMVEEVWMFMIIKSQQIKNFIDKDTKENIVLATRRKQRQDLVQAVYFVMEGRERVSPEYNQPSDKDGNSFVKTFKEKVRQEGEKT